MNLKKFFLLLASALLVFSVLFVAKPVSAGDSDPPTPVKVIKTANTSFNRTYDWTIEKSADFSTLTLTTGQVVVVTYEVTVDAVPIDSDWAVSGNITIGHNNTGIDAIIESVTDVITPGDLPADLSCPDFPVTLPAGWTAVCTYSRSLPNGDPRTNTATATTSGLIPGGTGTAGVSFGEPTDVVDECIDVTDSYAGPLGTVCIGDDLPHTFTYTRQVGPYAVCGTDKLENTASFVTNDTGATGASSWTVDVDVPCAGGCTLTPGYWKTHSTYGPAPYDDTWAEIGEDTPFFLSGQSYYQVLWTSPQGNAYYILAHAYIAAQLNLENGASAPANVQAALALADVLFSNFTPAQIAALKGNQGVRPQFILYAALLDNYNNGLIGPGHCSE